VFCAARVQPEDSAEITRLKVGAVEASDQVDSPMMHVNTIANKMKDRLLSVNKYIIYERLLLYLSSNVHRKRDVWDHKRCLIQNVKLALYEC